MRRRSRRPARLFFYPLLLLLLICGVVTLIGLAAVFNAPVDDEETSNVRRLQYGLSFSPSGFDPHFNASAELGIPFMSVYDTLVYRHPQTRAFEPGLAESWQISEDRLTYTFFLKQGVTFHDGQPFNAGAVGVNLDRITDLEFGSQRARGLLGPNYAGYAIADDYTIQINLVAPYEPLLDGLSQVYLGIASPLALANSEEGTYQWHQVGTGPYRLKEFIPGELILLERNPAYAWGPPFYTTENPNPIEEVEFRFFTDTPTRDDALQSGQVDVIGELPPVDVELLSGNTDITIYPTSIPGQPLQFIFNLNQFPLDDVNVRQALITATNRTAIVDSVFAGQSPVAYGPLSSATEFYNPEVSAFYPYSLTEAEALFRAGGVEDTNDDGRLDKNGVPLELNLLVASNFYLVPEVAQAVADQWEQLGITVNIEQVPNYGTLLERIAAREFHAVVEYSFGLDASLLNDYYTTMGTRNWSGYSNPTVDEYLTQAIGEADPNTRASLYLDVQQQIMNDAVVLPIREYVNLNGADSELDGLIFSASGWWPLLHNLQWGD